jgi:phosphoribosylformylglycinamidine cyclo-ligase
MTDAYAASGVDTSAADRGVAALVRVLRTIDTGKASRTVPLPGHFAAVLEVAPNLGIAVGTDGVGSKLLVAEATGRLDTVGIDCVAMNVNDVVCVGAEPIAVLDYLAVEQVDGEAMRAIAEGLKRGAELAGVEIPGGEVAVLPELIRGHPSPHGFDLTAACFGTVALDAIVTGADCAPGDALLGLPSSGLHSNGFSLARRACAGMPLDERPDEFGGETLADVLLEPTVIYVRAVLELLRSGLPVHGLAHITGGGVLNLTRLSADVGFEITDPLPVPAIFDLVRERGEVAEAEMWEVFNMGCGFCAVVPETAAEEAAALLAAHHPGTRRIGTVTDRARRVEIPSVPRAFQQP